MQKYISIRGARQNNLKNVDVDIPKDSLTVITGLSGSGKSSLAFDTLYAEGQRRYIESLSSYARLFLGQMDKPDVDSIDGLSPAISIDQKTRSNNPRSTVGTITEIYDYMRLLWARTGIPHCPKCGKEIKRQTVDQIVDCIMSYPEGTRFQIMAPVIRMKKGEHRKVFEDAKRSGYVRVRVDGEVYGLDEDISLDKNKRHKIDVIVDRLVIKESIVHRLASSVETAFSLADGLMTVLFFTDNGEVENIFSQNYACSDCGIFLEEVTPRMFSFNNPYGACPKCSGLGIQLLIDPALVLPDYDLSLNEGAVNCAGWNDTRPGTISEMYYKALGEEYGFTLNTPLKDYSEEAINALLYGTGEKALKLESVSDYKSIKLFKPFEGLIPNMERRYAESSSEQSKTQIEGCMSQSPCPVCSGRRLKPESLAVTVGDLNISEFSDLSVSDALNFINNLKLTGNAEIISRGILKELKARLGFLADVGLNYLTLSRNASTLSGGESQRIRLATQIGSALTGVLYILDEPSIGLHQSDNEKLLGALKKLRDIGNTLVVVEHDEDTIESADYIVDVGPGAGTGGGEIVAAGTYAEVCNIENSITAQYLTGKKFIPVPEERRSGNGKLLRISGAREHNLKNITVDFPLGKFICVTGVSGSGKSSLVNEILFKKSSSVLNRSKIKAGEFDKIEGLENLDKVIAIDQSPIGRTPRSNPATYTGVFTEIRNLFAETNDAKIRGYGKNRFSFNVKGGRCEACSGDGEIKVEMHFLPDIYIPCEVCKGKKYNRETLEVQYKGKNIFDVLDMTASEAAEFFKNQPRIYSKLKTLCDVGLGYIKLGQSSITLSGGEAQRVKLATELLKRDTGKTLYILDEPTTGLHTDDVSKLIKIINSLTDKGNTIVVIEHNMHVIKCADYIIDLGPRGGNEGGELIFSGTPEECAQCNKSLTGQALRKYLWTN